MIAADRCYTVKEFRDLTGIGDFSWRVLRREMHICIVGKKAYIRGVDWLAYLETKKTLGPPAKRHYAPRVKATTKQPVTA